MKHTLDCKCAGDGCRLGLPKNIEQPKSRFYKKIVQLNSRVEAYVYDEKHVCVGWEWFFTFSQEYRLKKAHKWADKYIKNCEKYVGEFK